MTSKYELARALFRNSRDVVMEGFGGTLPSYQVEAVAVADSDDGTVLVALDGETFTEDGDVVKYSSTSDGTEVTLDGASSISAFSVDGQTTQEGETITSISSLALVVTRDGAEISSTTVDLDGNELRSLPDGTCDVLFVGEEGSSYIAKTVGVTLQAETDGIEGTVGQDIISSTGVIEDGATVLYPLYEIEYVALPQFTYPEVEDGDVLATDPSAYFEVTWALAEPVEGTVTPDMQLVAVPCSSDVMEGDTVIVTVQSNKFVDSTVIGSGDRMSTRVASASEAAQQALTLATEAEQIASAIGQFAWNDANGTHVSTEEGVAAGTRNILLNSYGILLRAAANYLAALTQSGIAFYDGTGNLAENVVASFGSNGAQIGNIDETLGHSADQYKMLLDSSGLHIVFQGTQDAVVYETPTEITSLGVGVLDLLGLHLESYNGGSGSNYSTIKSNNKELYISSGSSYADRGIYIGDFDPTAAKHPVTIYGNTGVNGNLTVNGTTTHSNQVKFASVTALPNASTSTDFFATGINAFANGGRLAYKNLADMRSWLGLGATTSWAYINGNASSASYVRWMAVNGVVYVQVNMQAGSFGTVANPSTKSIATVPSGYRPSKQVSSSATANTNNVVSLWVKTDGTVNVGPIGGSINACYGHVTYPLG